MRDGDNIKSAEKSCRCSEFYPMFSFEHGKVKTEK